MNNQPETAQAIIESQSLTANEIAVIKYLNEALKHNFGEGWSGEDAASIAQAIGQNVNFAKGVIGSLVKKRILSTDSQYDQISFRFQSDMRYEQTNQPPTII